MTFHLVFHHSEEEQETKQTADNLHNTISSFSFTMGSGREELPPERTLRISASLCAFVVERQRREGRGVEVAHNLVQTGDLFLQKVVLLLSDVLPLLRDLQGLQQLSVLHVEVVD